MQDFAKVAQSHPNKINLDESLYTSALKAIEECGAACTSCADACLSESNVQQLTKCIRLNLDCADICDATSRVLMRQTQPDMDVLRNQVETCMLACRSCGGECARHSHHEHCKACAASCQNCESECEDLLKAFPAKA